MEIVSQFSGYEALKLVDIPKPALSDGKVLLRMTAAGVTPFEHTIVSGQFPLAKAIVSMVELLALSSTCLRNVNNHKSFGGENHVERS
jgi:hypothetical protein